MSTPKSSERSPVRNSKRKMAIRKVRIGGSSIHAVDSSPEDKNVIWYDYEDLQKMKRAEIRNNKIVSEEAGKPGMDAAGLTWRGFESIQQGYSREERSRSYARLVVQQYKAQLRDRSGQSDEKELRQFAKGHSKDERQKARKRAEQDAKEAKEEFKKSKDSLVLGKDSKYTKIGISKRIQWFQRPRSGRIANDLSHLVYV
jgi:hypothetical protein